MDKGLDQVGFAARHAMEKTLQHRLTTLATPGGGVSSSGGSTISTSSRSDRTTTSLSWTLLMSVAAIASTTGMYLWQRKQREKILNSRNKTNQIIYLDYNGTTPVDRQVLDAMMPYLTTHFGNPSSSHGLGKEPRKAIDKARRSILKLLGVESVQPLSSIWFTGCGTESDNLAIRLALLANDNKVKGTPHIVSCNVEHPAILGYLNQLQDRGEIDVSYVPVGEDGRVEAKDVIEAIQPERTVLVTLMYANNETGALQPVREVAHVCREKGILMHTDAAQAVGKVDVSLSESGSTSGIGPVDMVSVVGHKIGAPKGIAALYVRDKCLQEHGRTQPTGGVLLVGGGQEFGHRGGTENTPYIVGFGKAALLACEHWKVRAMEMEKLRSRLLSNLKEHLENDGSAINVRPNGPSNPSLRLPNTLSVGIRNVHSGDLIASVGHLVAASAGATCHSTAAISSVLTAMNVPENFARGTLRLSMGPTMTQDEIDRASLIIVEAVRKQWKKQNDSNSNSSQ